MATTVRARLRRRPWRRPSLGVRRRQPRVLVVQLLGPVTMIAGLVWALVQPYRIAFLHPEGKGAYDYLVQPPLLVVVVGLLYLLLVAPGLVEDLERNDGPAS
jgi:uncharacterized membrane protein